MMAAPNRSRITARVLAVKQSPDWPDKWLLDIEILASEGVEGPNFATPGRRGPAFVIGEKCDVPVMSTIQAFGEYIGDGHGGQWQLTDVAVQG